MSSTISRMAAARPCRAAPRVNYLNVAYGVKSWLLTTDHKRIACLPDLDHPVLLPGRGRPRR